MTTAILDQAMAWYSILVLWVALLGVLGLLAAAPGALAHFHQRIAIRRRLRAIRRMP